MGSPSEEGYSISGGAEATVAMGRTPEHGKGLGRVSDPLLREILGASTIYVGAFPEELGYLYYLHLLYATLH